MAADASPMAPMVAEGANGRRGSAEGAEMVADGRRGSLKLCRTLQDRLIDGSGRDAAACSG